MTGLNSKFTWDDETEEEFITMKRYVKDNVKLSPFNMSEEIHLKILRRVSFMLNLCVCKNLYTLRFF